MPTEQAPVALAATRPTYLFVDSVRFWSMLGIVAMHSIITVRFNPSEGFSPLALLSFFKFGTIAFFLISGFLLGGRVDVTDPIQYLSRRLKTLLLPWGFWVSLYVLYTMILDLLSHRIITTSAHSWIQVFRAEGAEALFASWFVPNLAVCMCILVFFRRYLQDVRFGLALFAINLVYVANIYGQWFPASHNPAVLGFVCFLWLGAYASRNFAALSRFVDRVPLPMMAVATLLTYALSLAEIQLLFKIHNPEVENTLRLSNQIFSVAIVLLLMKLKLRSWPSFINVRQQTFCIYLVHLFFLRAAFGGLNRTVGPEWMAGAYPSLSFALRVALFVFAYGGSLLLGRLILASDQWRWSIGAGPRSQQSEAMERNRATRIELPRQNLPVT